MKTISAIKDMINFNIILFACLLNTCACGNAVEVIDDDSVYQISEDGTAVTDNSAENIAETSQLDFATAEDAIEYMKNSGEWGRYSTGILPRMAKDYLPYAVKLLNSPYDAFIIVDKGGMKVRYFDKYGVEQHCYGMACARNYGTKHKRGDLRTPEGFFSVEGVYNSENWLFTDDNGQTSQVKGQFGPRFIRLKTPVSTQIGIHGTSAPWSIGSRRTHGCIRLRNNDILELYKLVSKGMPVIVVPGKRDMAVDRKEGYDVPWVASNSYR